MVKQVIKQAYRQWAKSYDSDAKFNSPMEAEEGLVIPLLKPRSTDVILDIGCGTGRLTIPLSKQCKQIIGIDASKEMLAIAKLKSKNVEWKLVDITKKLPFSDNYFNEVLCTLVMDHLDELSPFFKEIHRVLKSGGTFVFDDVTVDVEKPCKCVYRDPLMEICKSGKKVFYHHDLREQINTLHRIGFSIETIKPMRFDEKIKHTMTPESYRKNKGRTAGMLFKAIKD